MSLPAHRAFRKQAPKKAGYLSQILSSGVCRSPGLLFSSAVILVGGSLIRKQIQNDNNLGLTQMSTNAYKDMFQKGPVFYVWGLFWFRVFQKQQIHDSLLSLLIGAINEPQFVNDSAIFGQNWI